MKISLLHPSHGRPAKALQTAVNWVNHAGVPIEYILSLDTSDKTAQGRESDYCQLANYLTMGNFGYPIFNDNTCVVEATNHAAKKATGDILLYLSDDFECFPNWGEAIIKEFADANGPRLVKVNDGYQPFDVKVLTIPIMNRELYETLGYFWYPGYKSMFVDEDLYHTVDKLNAIHFAPHLLFEHMHPAAGKGKNDETYQRSAINWNQGKALFAKRKADNFPL